MRLLRSALWSWLGLSWSDVSDYERFWNAGIVALGSKPA